MKVHSLWVYPVKSLAGICVDELELDDFGPAGDRRWMIVDEEGHFVTQRSHPELATIQVSLVEGQVQLGIPGQGSFTLKPTGERITTLVWRDWTSALLGRPDASEALSRFCSSSVRFVYMPDDSFRRVDPERVKERRRVSFADGFPLLVTNLSSLEELNSRLQVPVEMRRFRPNVVVQGAAPWDEDHWRELDLGACRLSLVKPCSRCVMTTVDPDLGVKDPATQPLKTLSGYRRTEDGVIFGMNAVHNSAGRIQVGDSITMIKTE